MIDRLRLIADRFTSRTATGTGSIPVLIFAVGFLALALLTLNMGFFQDDWHHVYYFDHAGLQGLQQFLFFDGRPLSFLVYDAFFLLLGVDPLGWHLLLFVFRFLTVLAFWQVLNVIWPGAAKANAMAALLFLVYPVFLLQPLSVAYALHWSMYLVYMASILLMLLAARKGSRALVLGLGSILLQVFHLLMIEYFFGIELLRPIFLWLAYRGQPRAGRLKQTIFAWLPYFLVDAGYILYRASYNRIYGYERFGDMLFFDLLSQPLSLIGFYLRAALQDFTEVLLTGWYAALQPSAFEFPSPAHILLWLSVISVILVAWVYLRALKPEGSLPDSEIAWQKELLFVGLLSIFCGIVPGWIIGKTVYGSNPLWNDRFALAALFGAAMVWVGLLNILIPKASHRYFIFSLMIGLALGLNLRTQLDFKNGWEKQQDFYWQLLWRAPYLQPGTLLISDGEFLPYMGSYPTTFAINTLYPQAADPRALSYWVSNNQEHLPAWDEFRSGTELEFFKYASSYEGNTTESITISFLPEQGQCLWVYPPEYAFFPFLSPGLKETMPVSNLDRIRRQPAQGWTPPVKILGPAPAQDWCYYFEKADLAAQFEDWPEAVRLWEEARAQDLGPRHGVEFFPFIRAFAMQSEWQPAVQLTISASKISERMTAAVCGFWDQIKTQTADSPDLQDSLQRINDRFSCGL